MIDAGADGSSVTRLRQRGSAAGCCQRAGADSYLPIKTRELASSRRRAARRRMGCAASSTTRLGRVPLDDSSGRLRAVLRVRFGLWPIPPRASVGAACVGCTGAGLCLVARSRAHCQSPTFCSAQRAGEGGMTDDLLGKIWHSPPVASRSQVPIPHCDPRQTSSQQARSPLTNASPHR